MRCLGNPESRASQVEYVVWAFPSFPPQRRPLLPACAWRVVEAASRPGTFPDLVGRHQIVVGSDYSLLCGSPNWPRAPAALAGDVGSNPTSCKGFKLAVDSVKGSSAKAALPELRGSTTGGCLTDKLWGSRHLSIVQNSLGVGSFL